MTPAALYRRLSWGRDRAVPIGEIAEAAGCYRRQVEKAAEALRAEGAPLCSCGDGIYLTDDADELMEMYRTLRRRAIGQLRNARRLRVTAEAFRRQGQMRLAL